MATSANPLNAFHFFGIRHHGPGCARSLLHALEQLQPDCLLVEGPPEGEALLARLADADLRPPVALLVYRQEQPAQAAFYPFAEFSPEWQALQWAVQRQVPTRLIDLPQTHAMALEAEQQQACQEAEDAEPDAEATAPQPGATQPPAPEPDADTAPTASDIPADPLDWLAQAAGYADGERWWNRLVEERGDSEALFASIAEAMSAVRSELPEDWRGASRTRHENLREAWMRQCLREAAKAGHQRVAVVCGAWHVPALQAAITAKSDAVLLKGLPKVKVQATWTPWTYRNLSMASGYGAGVASPGWYAHLWQCSQTATAATETTASAVPATTLRTAGWLARVARLLRERDLDCSSAHIIEATRLAEGLAALRGQPSSGLEELNEAIQTVICMGETAPLQLIEQELTVGDVLGSVPPDVPQVPLQRDIEQQQKTLRLKPEAAARVLALDLRKELDLQRSHFLHRLRLLGIGWGTPAHDAQRNRGTFRESWSLQWEPELAVRIIEASIHGATVAQAATTRLRQNLTPEAPLPAIAQAIDDALLANLPALVQSLMHTLAERAATTGDVGQLLCALPPLAQVYRYGSVRQTDTALLASVIDSLVLRAAIGLPVACMALDAEAATDMHTQVLAAHEALRLRDSGTASEPTAAVPDEAAAEAALRQAWQTALRSLAQGDAAAALLRGMACRLLLDAHLLDGAQVATQLARNLSLGVPPLDAAAWLDGFLNQQALVLLHDEAIWGAVDAWLSQLGEAQFVQILPLVRRSFSAFSQHERQSLGEKARRTHVQPPDSGAATAAAAVALATPDPQTDASPWDEDRAALALPLLGRLLGLEPPAVEASARSEP